MFSLWIVQFVVEAIVRMTFHKLNMNNHVVPPTAQCNSCTMQHHLQLQSGIPQTEHILQTAQYISLWVTGISKLFYVFQ